STGLQIWRAWTDQTTEPFQIQRADSAEWTAIGIPGIEVRRLGVNVREQRVTMLIRMAAGTQYPAHRHGGLEEGYVVEGDLRIGSTVLHGGDFISSETHSIHEIQSTKGGCLLLIQSSQSDELLPDAPSTRMHD